MNSDETFYDRLVPTVRAEEREACERRIAFLFGGPSDAGRWHYLMRYVRLIAHSEHTTPYDLLWNLVQQHTRAEQEAREDRYMGDGVDMAFVGAISQECKRGEHGACVGWLRLPAPEGRIVPCVCSCGHPVVLSAESGTNGP